MFMLVSSGNVESNSFSVVFLVVLMVCGILSRFRCILVLGLSSCLEVMRNSSV